jgi:isopenicillin N synthase-like dioxygenase
MTLLHVPLIDLSPFYSGDADKKKRVAREIDQACRDIGFLVVTGHQVDPALINAVQEVSQEFFDLPEAEKLKLRPPFEAIIRGYSPMMGEGLSFSIGEEAPADIKEIVTMGPPGAPEARYLMGADYYARQDAGSFFAPNVWPERPQTMRPLWEEYFRVMERFARELHQLCALALDLPENYFDALIDKHFSVLRVLHYPKITKEPEPGQVRAGEHSDYDDLSICVVQPGLQTRNRSGEWVDVPVIEGALVINLGDFLMRWTNDRWVSNRHRVINPPLASDANASRLSLIYFCNCNYDATIECLPTCHDADNPPKYPPIKTVDYITEKYSRQKGFEVWSEDDTASFGTGDTESRFKAQ